MIEDYAAAIAAQMNIQFSKITLVDGRRLGCNDAHLLNVFSDGKVVSILAYQSDLDELQRNNVCDRLETRIRSSLSRLQTGHPMYKRLLHRENVKDGTCLLVKNSLYIGIIKNISLGGLFVTSNIPVKVMDRIKVSIILSSDSEVIDIEADTVATRVENGGIAIKYDYLDPKGLRMLKSYLHRLARPSLCTH